MVSPRDKSSDRYDRKLLKLLHLLADFDGEISAEAAALLNQLRHRPDLVPPLYADVFGLPIATTCSSLVQRIETLTPAQNAVASYAFTIFRSYEQMLGVQSSAKPEQQAAYDSQLEQVRLQVAKTKLVLAEALAKSPE
ncbi:MAG: hypothetical protein KME07_01445 [Pegethrix bostrychoides GSE-TBD4-15B]|jgi:hypothetical protein|uniref:Uncharacterized protein n=1 Tax=Pegethrix bostrychoides GSE-TBD4-15B TaxID=2839662 RepID=A0A951P7A6_9CYAN|nr:hypothetical protein [Pegethrix bostrychoides GSE-TBD4-15B]